MRSSLISQTVVYAVDSLGNFPLCTWSGSLGQKLMKMARLQAAPERQAGRMHTQAGFSHTQKAALKPREKLRHWCSSPPSWGKYSSPPARTLHRQIGFFPFDIRCLKGELGHFIDEVQGSVSLSQQQQPVTTRPSALFLLWVVLTTPWLLY